MIKYYNYTEDTSIENTLDNRGQLEEVRLMEIKEIVKNFDIDGNFKAYNSFGNGHINDTYALTFKQGNSIRRYILQRMNESVFPNIDDLMNNIVKVCDYLKDIAVKRGEDPERKCMSIIKTRDGNYYHTAANGEKWRCMVLIEDTEAYQIAVDTGVFEATGKAFGEFINFLQDFPVHELKVVIPNFHNTLSRFRAFTKALKANSYKRRRYCRDEIKFCLEREDNCAHIVEMLASGEMPLRVTHNDTKINNILMDSDTGEAVCVIDLDTIMPGSIVYDFGDGIRSGCNTALEDEKDLSKVHFNMEMFEYFAKGFIDGMGKNLLEVEKDNLAYGAILITFECGMRFLTDYLDGDKYFKTDYGNHNLVRARTQFKLVKDMEASLDEMNKIVDKYYSEMMNRN